MVRVIVGFIACCCTLGVIESRATAQSWPPTKESANANVLEWLRSNNKFGPDSNFVNDMSQVAKEEIEKDMNINFFFGSDLMDAGSFKSLCVLANQMVILDMTPEQAAAMELEASSVTTTTSGVHGAAAEKQSFELSQLTVNGGDAIGSHAKITGEIRCTAQGESPSKEYALRLSYRASQGVSQFKYLDSAPDTSGLTIQFEFDAVNDEGVDEPFKGAMPLLFDIVTVDQSGGDVNITVHSNLIGTMATVRD